MRSAPALALALSCIALAARAADVEAGRKLVHEKGCESCHARKAGDGGAMYTRRDRHVTTLPKLRSQVALCNTELGLGLFPDEEDQVVDYLDAAYYRFGAAGSNAR